jgi:hypothetical protein
MGDIEFRDWFPPLVAALLGGSFGALIGGVIGWWGNARVQREARHARVQMERKREIYQPLYRQLRQSRRFLEENPFPNRVRWDPDEQHEYRDPSYSLWISLNREGRNAEVSADIVETFRQIEKTTGAYLQAFGQVRRKWREHGQAYAADKEKEQPSNVLPNNAGLRLFDHVLRGGEVTESEPVYALEEDTLPGHEIRGQELLQSIPEAHAEIAEVQSTARALAQAFASAEAGLEKKIRHITEKYEGG